MKRLTYKTNGRYINTAAEQAAPYAIDCDIDSAITKLAEYEDLEERLQTIYGECGGLLAKTVEHLERHEGVDFPGPVHKARLLTDGEADRWENFKRLEEQGKLLKPPCAVGDRLYEPRPDRGIVTEYRVSGLTYSGTGWFIGWMLNSGIYSSLDGVSADRIGRTVFLTREEAEAALGEVSGESEGGKRK